MIALGIVFLVLLTLLVILKINKHDDQNPKNAKMLISCDQQQIIFINSKIDKVVDAKDEILVLTEEKSGEQELIALDKKCGFLKRKIKFNIQ